MQAPLIHRRLLGVNALSAQDEAAVLSSAGMLRDASRSGTLPRLLRGKQLGLVCAADDHPDAVLFHRAATELGAHVAHLRTHLTEHQTPEQVRSAARMLGRLYDAVECQGMRPDLLHQVACEAGVPVYGGLACRTHPSAGLADRLGHEVEAGENRRCVVQALLLSTVG